MWKIIYILFKILLIIIKIICIPFILKTETDDIFYKTYEEARFKAIEYALLNEEFYDKVWKK